MKKRILALLMALVLTVSCLPPVALAEGTQATEANIQSAEQTQIALPEKVEEETAPALRAAHGAHTCEDCSDSSVEWKAWESGSDLPNKGDRDIFGGGAGAGVNVTPVAFLVVRDGDVKMLLVVAKPDTVDRAVSMVPDMVDKVVGLFKKDEPASELEPFNAEQIDEILLEQ